MPDHEDNQDGKDNMLLYAVSAEEPGAVVLRRYYNNTMKTLINSDGRYGLYVKYLLAP
jgi:hypothetical protein